MEIGYGENAATAFPPFVFSRVLLAEPLHINESLSFFQ
jgi:hypothetical protein